MTAILNGISLTLEKELQSLMLYNYGVFTTFLFQGGKVKGLDLHLQRLQADCQALFGSKPSNLEIKQQLQRFLQEFGSAETVVIRITVFPQTFSLTHPENINHLNILVTGRIANPIQPKPLKLMEVEADRPFPHHKTTTLTVNLYARRIAKQHGYDDALLIHRGLVTEGTTWNIFFLQGNHLFTPPLTDGLLPGIVRGQILQGASHSGFHVWEKSIEPETYEAYDSCFICNSVLGIVTVACVQTKIQHFNHQSKTVVYIQELYEKIERQTIEGI
jgi:branched-subunit amino acid aminotransferase/4-amino-4-deoxychorismate lyase